MVDAYCNRQDCKAPMGGDEFGLSLMDFGSKKLYIKALQEAHDYNTHTSKKEQLTCECGHESKDFQEALDHTGICPKLNETGVKK